MTESHGAPEGWQNTVRDPAFTWGGASDGSGSGVASYKYYWGINADGAPDQSTALTSFDPPAPCSPGETCQRYLRIQTFDAVWRSSQPVTIYTFGYDGQPPTGNFKINNGSTTAYQVAVEIAVSASDVGSGLHRMRLSNDGLNWPRGWQAFEPSLWWSLDALPNQLQTVHIEISDQAGNITVLAPQQIYLDLSGGKPKSTNYQIMTDVQGRGGGTQNSSSYRLNSTIGQTIAGAGVSGQLYSLESGFQGAWLAQPMGPPPVEHYQLLNSVIGQAGGYMASTGYRLNGTAGQSAETGLRISTNYQLLSGFWSRIARIGAGQPTPTPTVPLAPTATSQPSPTPVPTSTPPPESEYYGVSINDASLYTSDYQVTLSLYAQDAVEMMVSNDGGFVDAYWEAYAITKTWEIDYYQDYVLPRTVYVRYRDAGGVIHGNFTDDIIYDSNLPEGAVALNSFAGGTATVQLDLVDDLSGVSQVLIATLDGLPTAQWENYSSSKTTSAQPGDLIYIFYRDAAGNQSLYPLEILVPNDRHTLYLPITSKN